MTLNLNVKNYRPMNLWSYILKRMLLMIPTLLGVIAITFAVIQFVPGGPVEQVLIELKKGQTGAGESSGVARRNIAADKVSMPSVCKRSRRCMALTSRPSSVSGAC